MALTEFAQASVVRCRSAGSLSENWLVVGWLLMGATGPGVSHLLTGKPGLVHMVSTREPEAAREGEASA